MKRILLILALVGLFAYSADAQRKIPSTFRTTSKATTHRTEIVLPEVKGFNCYKADFHIHTSYSDGQLTPAGRVEEAWYDGLDIIAITDHLESRSGESRFLKVIAPYNKNGNPTRYLPAGSTKMPKNGEDPGIKADFNAIHSEAERTVRIKGYPMLLIKGCEMARNKEKLGHYNALFLKDINTIYNFDIKEAFRNVQKQGGIIIHNHPGNTENYETEWHKDAYDSGLINGVEVANGLRYYPPMVQRCIDKKLTMFGNTDIHGSTERMYRTVDCFRTMTIVMAKDLTEKAVKDAILKRRTIVYSGGSLIGELSWLTEFLNASVECRILKEDAKKGVRTYILTNTTSITYQLRRGKTIYELKPFSSIVVSIGKSKKTGAYVGPRFRVDNMWIADHKHPTIEFKLDK